MLSGPSMLSALAHSTAVSSPLGRFSGVEDLAHPLGFTWGATCSFDEIREQHVIGRVVSTQSIRPPPLVSPLVSPRVVSWFDARIRSQPATPRSPPPLTSIDELTIGRRIGQGTQCEVRLGELPGHADPVAVKVGLKSGAIAIAREAEVLSALSGVPGFPTLLHHEVAGPDTPGGALIMNLLGPDLDDLLHGPKQSDGRGAPKVVAASTLLRVGATLLRLLRSLHRAGFVHNDVKPSNILLDAGATTLEPRSRLYLVDFGSCTRAPGCIGAVGERGAVGGDSQPHGPLGSILFASVAADECDAHSCATRPADDIESLVYTLTYLAAGSLPWHGQPAALTTSIKREMLTSRSSVVAALTDGVDCPTCTQALQALYAEVRRCHQSGSGAEIDYEACLAVFDEHFVLSTR